jgi:predicted DNA-binding WGR domain protein
MARFELHDGPLKKFWEIELQGDTLHFRMGDIGSPGRKRSKRHRNESAAEDAYEKAVRAMVAQGYEQELDADEAEELVGPTWSRLTEDPMDREALGVHADWLMGRDDPRGEVLAKALDLDRKGDAAGLEKLQTDKQVVLVGDLSAFPGTARVTHGLGFVSHAVLLGSGTDAPNAAVEVLRHDGFALVQDLTLHMPAAVKVVLSGNLPAVRRLDLQTGLDTVSTTRTSDLDLDRLAVKAPRLRDLRVRGPNAITGSDAVTGLQHLDIAEAPGWLEAIVRARPALLTLHVRATTAEGLLELRQQGLLESVTELGISPAWDADMAALLQVLEGLQLERLTLRDVQLEASHAATLVRFTGIEDLVVEGAVSAEAEALLQERSVRGAYEVEEFDDREPSRPADLVLTRLERSTSRGKRFWAIGIDGKVHHVQYGTGSGAGKWIWTRFPSADVAEEIAERRIEEKLREGYLPVGAE